MKTSKLIGALLDYWVAKADGMQHVRINDDAEPPECYMWEQERGIGSGEPYSPSSNWKLGGPIIERERIELFAPANSPEWAKWEAKLHPNGSFARIASGETALIAAMRAYVASKFGDEVPNER